MKLFIDTAVTGCNLVLFTDNEVLASAQEPIERGHAETVLPLYQTLMQQVNKCAEDIESVFVTVGPGSFTGLRVGLTVARFIGFSLNKPVHGLTTFQALSAGVDTNQNRLVLIETKRSDYYCQLLGANHHPLQEAASLSSTDVTELITNQTESPIIIGDAVERFMQEISISDIEAINTPMIDAVKTVKVIQQGQMELTEAKAFYIRDAEVSQPKNKH